MNDINNNRSNRIEHELNEDIFVAVFKKCAHEYLKNEQAKYVETDVLSEASDKRIKKRINKQTAKQAAGRVGKRSLKVAAAVLVVVALCSITIVSVDAFRIPVFNLFLQNNGRSTTISMDEEPSSSQQLFEPSYIPVGFELSKCDEQEGSIVMIYNNAAGDAIYITQYDPGANFGIDTENAETGSIEINGYDGMYSIKNGIVILVFRTESHAFLITAPVDISEIVKIAQSMQ